jgi:hypothetical protein
MGHLIVTRASIHGFLVTQTETGGLLLPGQIL